MLIFPGSSGDCLCIRVRGCLLPAPGPARFPVEGTARAVRETGNRAERELAPDCGHAVVCHSYYRALTMPGPSNRPLFPVPVDPEAQERKNANREGEGRQHQHARTKGRACYCNVPDDMSCVARSHTSSRSLILCSVDRSVDRSVARTVLFPTGVTGRWRTEPA